jgi:hypothetical protein
MTETTIVTTAESPPPEPPPSSTDETTAALVETATLAGAAAAAAQAATIQSSEAELTVSILASQVSELRAENVALRTEMVTMSGRLAAVEASEQDDVEDVEEIPVPPAPASKEPPEKQRSWLGTMLLGKPRGGSPGE